MFQASLVFLSLLLVQALSLQAQKIDTPISVRGVAGFENPEQLLRQLVRARSRLPVHHFCVVGYKDTGDSVNAWVHWVEGKALILWEPASANPLPLIASRRYLNLERDVVASEEDIKGSTYLVTRTWVNTVLADCTRVGDRYTVRRVSQPNKR
jgi:hypothetical protein